MRESEKSICNDILREGTIEREEEYTCEGIMVKQYTVSYAGQSYELTKNNGEWVYIHRN